MPMNSTRQPLERTPSGLFQAISPLLYVLMIPHIPIKGPPKAEKKHSPMEPQFIWDGHPFLGSTLGNLKSSQFQKQFGPLLFLLNKREKQATKTFQPLDSNSRMG